MKEQSGHCDASGRGAPEGAAPRTQRNPGADLHKDWPAYFDAVAGNPARDTLLEALRLFDEDGPVDGELLGVDLGCGSGRDSVEMLRRGWRVVAIDGSEDGLARLGAHGALPPDAASRLRTVHADFIGLDLAAVAPEGADLVNASFSLPFCPPEHFGALWGQIGRTLDRAAARGRRARFAGQFFGDRDEWKVIRERVHHTRTEVERLLEGFDLEKFEETEKDGNDAFGNPKHYHVFHVVARRRPWAREDG